MCFNLEESISDLMTYYRKQYPNESITPKLHLLESHAVGFIQNWGAGFGLYGEQGAESVHAMFNNMHHTYSRIKPNSRRLEAMMKEHFTRIHPLAKHLRPQIKRRRKNYGKYEE